jgi:hypothetical protein
VLVLHPRSQADGGGPRGDRLLPPAGRARHRGVLRRRPLRRVLGRRSPDLGRTGGRVRASPHGTSTSCPTPWPRTPAPSPCGSCATPTATSPPSSTRCAPRPASDRADHRDPRRRRCPRGIPLASADDQGRVGDRQMREAIAATKVGFEAVIADLDGAVERGKRRALGRGPVRPARPPPGQRHGLRLDLRGRRPRQHPALDQEHRRGPRGRHDPPARRRASRSTASTPPTSRAPCPSTAPSPTRNARSTTRCMPHSKRAWRPSSRARSSPTSTRPRSGSSPSICTRGGCCPRVIDVEDTLDTETGQYHRRWMVHGTSHHLGIDVHDCALATREEYMDAELQSRDDPHRRAGALLQGRRPELAPERFRGHGVRIEDDVLVTETGYENLSAGMPRTSRGRRSLDRTGPGPLSAPATGSAAGTALRTNRATAGANAQSARPLRCCLPGRYRW